MGTPRQCPLSVGVPLLPANWSDTDLRRVVARLFEKWAKLGEPWRTALTTRTPQAVPMLVDRLLIAWL